MKKRLLIALFVVTQSLASASFANAGGVNATAELYDLIESLQSLSADFDQRIVDRDQVVIQQSKGHFKLARPNKIYWKTQPPYEQEIVGDGSMLWVYDPDLEQVTQHNGSALMQGPMALFSDSLEGIDNRFEVSFSVEESNGASNQRYTLLPKQQAVNEGFSQLVFEFQNDRLSKIEIHDKLRQVTTLSLTNVQNNPKLSPERFVFIPPAGVDLLLSE